MIISKTFSRTLTFRPLSLHIFTLSSFALVQPLFDLLSRNATFFVVRRSEPLDILILCALMCVVLPLCLILFGKGLGWIHPKMGWWAHASMIGGFVAILMLQGLKQILVLPGTVLILGAMGIATLVTWSYTRSPSVRLFFSLLSPGLLIFPDCFCSSRRFLSLFFRTRLLAPSPSKWPNLLLLSLWSYLTNCPCTLFWTTKDR